MRIYVGVLALFAFAAPVRAEQYNCAYLSFTGNKPVPLAIEIKGSVGSTSEIGPNTYTVLRNTKTTVVLAQAHEEEPKKENSSGGLTAIVIDKKTGKMVRGNLFVTEESFKAWTKGECKPKL